MNHPNETAELVRNEVFRAEDIHPTWPDDVIHGAAIVCEESGELIRAAVQHRYEGGNLDDVITEAVHTAATACRLVDVLLTLKETDNVTPSPR
jgi:hypothetical protein